MKKIFNTLDFAINTGHFGILIKKFIRRIFATSGKLSISENHEWLKKNSIDFEDWKLNFDPKLWKESNNFSKSFESQARQKLSDLDVTLGGGANTKLLYYLVRKYEPDVVVETGVAAGYSSQAFLAALNKNGHGKLFSSDLPYFRIKDSQNYIGIVVEERFKNNWELHVNGDEKNLVEIVSKVNQVDLFHYDSDKSYTGRIKALNIIKRKLANNAILIFDDLEDNSLFYELVHEEYSGKSWKVIEYDDKFMGIIGI